MRGPVIYFFAWLLLFLATKAVAQTSPLERLQQMLEKQTEDTAKARLLAEIAQLKIRNQEYESAFKDVRRSLSFAEKANSEKAKGFATMILGYCYDAVSQYDSAIICYQNAMANFNASGDFNLLGKSKLAVGNAHYFKGNIKDALSAYIESYKYHERYADSTEMAGALMGVGNCYFDLHRYQNALESYLKAHGVYSRRNNKRLQSWLLSNIGDVYKAMGQNDPALDYFLKAVEMKKEAGENDFSLSTTYLGISDLYKIKKAHDKATYYVLLAIEARKKAGDVHELASAYQHAGSVYYSAKNYSKAKEMLEEAIGLAKSSQSLDVLQFCYYDMSNTLFESGNPKEAFQYRIRFEEARDSILNNESSAQMNRLTAQYENEKKEHQIALLNMDKEVQGAKLNKQKIVSWAVAIGLCLVIALALVILRSLRLNQKKNKIITEQKEQVEEKQKEILDSIYYARRIQQSLMTGEAYIQKSLKRLRKS